MSRKLLPLNWEDFDIAIGRLCYKLKGIDAVGIYGQPRGGLCLAVALSHHLNLPLLLEPQDGMIWVDDVCESGLTVANIQHKPAAKAVWVSMKPSFDVIAAYVTFDHPWVIFPWEDAEKALDDMEAYLATRQ